MFEGNWLLGKHRFKVDSSKRWTYNETANGLVILGSNLIASRMDASAKLAQLNFDIWDTRLEGELTAEAATKYAHKTIVVPVADGAIGDLGVSSVEAALKVGATLLIGNSGSDEGSKALEALIAKRTNKIEAEAFDQITLRQGNFFTAEQKELMIAVTTFGEDQPAEAWAHALGEFHLLTLSVPEKIAALETLFANPDSATSPKQLITNALLRDLFKEMTDDKAVDGKNFKEGVEKLRLSQFVSITLSKKGPPRHELLSLLPALDDSHKDVGWFLSLRRHRIKK
ncbi:hypothetical protein WDW86_13805 [Bdellovibrionota bacterium FG-2]